MSADYYLFFFFAGLAVIGGVNLLVQRHPIHSALSLILVMASLAVLYLLLGAEFIAAVQVIVYAGAIMVLFVFVIMLLNAGEEERTNLSKMAPLGVLVAVILMAQVCWLLYAAWPAEQTVNAGRFVAGVRPLAHLLFKDFALPFELTSILILIAILGAVVLAKKEL